MNRIRFFLFILAALFLGSCAVMEEDVTATLEYCFEGSEPFSPDELSRVVFTRAEPGPLHLGISEKPVWVRVSFYKPDNPPDDRILLELLTANLDSVSFFQVQGDSLLASYHTGEAFPFHTRPVPSSHFTFPVEYTDDRSELYLRVSSSKPLIIPVVMGLKDAVMFSQKRKDMFFSMYAGIVLVMLLYNFFIWLAVRERIYLYYVAAILFVGLTQLVINGYGSMYFWPNNVWIGARAVLFVGSLSGIFSLLFAQHYLKIKKYSKWLNLALNVYLALYIIAFLMAVLGWFSASFHMINLCGLAALLLAVAAVRSYRKGYKPALFFLVAWSVFLVAVTVYSLSGFGLLPFNIYTRLALPVGSAVEVVLLSFAVAHKIKFYREKSYNQLMTITTMKDAANEKLEREVVRRTEEIKRQNTVVENQKDEILAGIRYAERIQKSLLPASSEIKSLFDEHFVLLKPRDIVSGDFYWVGETSEENPWTAGLGLRLFAAVDCTGHGVPGALMSVLGKNGLDRCVDHPEVDSPATALAFINKEILRALHQERAADGVQDGMDMVLCAYDPDTKILHFAGAKNNIYIFRQGDFIVLKGDRISIGTASASNGTAFTDKEIQLESGDAVYTFTDGFPDQFGGASNKKLKSKPFLEIIAANASLPMREQKAALAAFFENWRGDRDQVDDVCVAGFRVL
ncbi:MAG: SpoIIE family protein phosphatase [Flavobacteriales bacterium]|nr:SpoIIE family protein phosphatase [Flavobacteriales bacterium]